MANADRRVKRSMTTFAHLAQLLSVQNLFILRSELDGTCGNTLCNRTDYLVSSLSFLPRVRSQRECKPAYFFICSMISSLLLLDALGDFISFWLYVQSLVKIKFIELWKKIERKIEGEPNGTTILR